MRRSYALALCAALLCAGALVSCEEAGCDLGCEEEEDDCLDDPMHYEHFGSCDPADRACIEGLCKGVYNSCASGCRASPAARDASGHFEE